MSEKQAIQLAEDFVRINGYTNGPGNKTKMSYELNDGWFESIDGKNHKDSVLKRRHDMLEPKASFISLGADGVYNVGFRSAHDSTGGRAVKVRQDGNVEMAHKTPLFSKFTRLK